MKFNLLILFGLLLNTGISAQQQIAYLSNESGNFDLFLIDEEGANKRQLTNNPGWDWSPQWNPGLAAILYNTADSSGKVSIQAMQLNGELISVDHKDLANFALSPDASKALYTLKDANNTYIGLYDLEQETNRLLVSTPAYNGRPIWSPKGDAFCFISDRDGNSELYVYDLSTHQQERLTQSEKREKYASWMPDGQAIVYTYHYSDERDQEHNDLFQINLKTKEIHQLTDDQHFYQEIAVSPDGQKIVFHAKRNGADHLFTIGINGKGEKQLTQVSAYHGEPIWIPKN